MAHEPGLQHVDDAAVVAADDEATVAGPQGVDPERRRDRVFVERRMEHGRGAEAADHQAVTGHDRGTLPLDRQPVLGDDGPRLRAVTRSVAS